MVGARSTESGRIGNLVKSEGYFAGIKVNIFLRNVFINKKLMKDNLSCLDTHVKII